MDEDFSKTVRLDNRTKEMINLENCAGYGLSIDRITEKKDYAIQKIECILKLRMHDDFYFSAASLDKTYKEASSIVFNIDNNDILYFPLIRLLGDRDKLTIYDYNTEDKYLLVNRDINNIALVFINNSTSTNPHDQIYKWFITVKNNNDLFSQELAMFFKDSELAFRNFNSLNKVKIKQE